MPENSFFGAECLQGNACFMSGRTTTPGSCRWVDLPVPRWWLLPRSCNSRASSSQQSQAVGMTGTGPVLLALSTAQTGCVGVRVFLQVS